MNGLHFDKICYNKDGAVGVINKLESYNCCILADSVGWVKLLPLLPLRSIIIFATSQSWRFVLNALNRIGGSIRATARRIFFIMTVFVLTCFSIRICRAKDLLDKLDIDFSVILDRVTIARSCKRIQKYYNCNTGVNINKQM